MVLRSRVRSLRGCRQEAIKLPLGGGEVSGLQAIQELSLFRERILEGRVAQGGQLGMYDHPVPAQDHPVLDRAGGLSIGELQVGDPSM